MRIDHVGIAVHSIEKALPFYREDLRLEVIHTETVPSQGVRVVFLAEAGAECLVELLEPIGSAGPIAKFLATHGSAMHHLAFWSNGVLAAEMERLRAKGRAPIEDQPRLGARGHRVCFLHPKNTNGILIELVG